MQLSSLKCHSTNYLFNNIDKRMKQIKTFKEKIHNQSTKSFASAASKEYLHHFILLILPPRATSTRKHKPNYPTSPFKDRHLILPTAIANYCSSNSLKTGMTSRASVFAFDQGSSQTCA